MRIFCTFFHKKKTNSAFSDFIEKLTYIVINFEQPAQIVILSGSMKHDIYRVHESCNLIQSSL